MRRPPASAAKRYDARYFLYWYRGARAGPSWHEFVARKVRFAVAATEYVLGRRIRSVLDVGCGEAPWRAVLKRLRPRVAYTGLDGSEYVVRRYGRTRNIRLARVGQVGRVGLKRPYDLVVCSDVLHYVPTPEMKRGLAAMRRLCRGVAFLEIYTGSDEAEGDDVEFQRRSAATYLRHIRAAGFEPLGPQLYAPRAVAETLVELERSPAR